MTYDYECLYCGRFEYCQVIGSQPIEQCPVCGKPCERLISGGIHAICNPGVTTVGKLMEKNSAKMGKYKLDELAPKEETSPTGLTKELSKKINKMTPKQKLDYIIKGK